jgi:hypothetical protein
MTKSVFYKSPFLYKLGLKFLHRENFSKRYKYLANLVEKGDSVLEPACGPGILADFLPKDCFYYGFDLNEKFINYCFSRNLRVLLKNALDPESYFPVDVVICVDLLHHLRPGERKLAIENCWQAAKKKLIICEPFLQKSQKEWLNKLNKQWFEYIERDGTNKPKLEDMWDKDTLEKQMLEGFGIIPKHFPREITKIGKDLIAIYFKKENNSIK